MRSFAQEKGEDIFWCETKVVRNVINAVQRRDITMSEGAFQVLKNERTFRSFHNRGVKSLKKCNLR